MPCVQACCLRLHTGLFIDWSNCQACCQLCCCQQCSVQLSRHCQMQLGPAAKWSMWGSCGRLQVTGAAMSQWAVACVCDRLTWQLKAAIVASYSENDQI